MAESNKPARGSYDDFKERYLRKLSDNKILPPDNVEDIMALIYVGLMTKQEIEMEIMQEQRDKAAELQKKKAKTPQIYTGREFRQ